MLQVNGFQRTGTIYLYPHQDDDSLKPLLADQEQFLRQAVSGRLRWGPNNNVWTDADGARSHVHFGYEKLPSGLIVQWGMPIATNGDQVTFPIAFPTRCGAVMMTEAHPTAAILLAADGVSATGYTLRARNMVNDTTLTIATQYMHFAIGY